MASYFSLHAYDADLWIPGFRGLNQADTGLNPDTRFAAEEYNVETPEGVLQPMAACPLLPGEFNSRVETLAVFHRRWYEGPGSKNWYICASGGQLYEKQEGSTLDWRPIPLPSPLTSFQSNRWSWVTYEKNDVVGTIDVVVMSNPLDGMIMLVPPERPSIWEDSLTYDWTNPLNQTWSDDASPQWVVTQIDTGDYKFGVIERYAERIWGGAIPDEPDVLAYSAPYDPTDWELNLEIPEDGAGEVRQPSWDGDQFYALRRFGDHLLAFKKNKIWQVLGVSPGEFVFQEQFGTGTENFETIAVAGERAYMACRDGVVMYDGVSTSMVGKDAIENIWRTVNLDALGQMCAVLFQDRYYLAFPTGDSTVNNAMLVFDLKENNILYYPGTQIESFLPGADDELYATSSSLPGRIIRMKRDSWQEGAAAGHATKWVTNWMDFGYKRIQKGGFDLYFIPEVQDEPVTFTISVQTEKKLKTKQYTCQPLTQEQKEAGKQHRGKRLHFGGTGRKFRVIIETAEGVTAPWRIVGGIQMVVETDPD